MLAFIFEVFYVGIFF